MQFKNLLFVWASILCRKCFSYEDTNFKRPNIVIIQADDLGWNDVGFHGADQIPTPNIDALAYNGLILNRHYVLPTCTPSRTAFMTGRHPIRTGLQGYPLSVGTARGIPLTEKLMPRYFKQLGYVTRLVGKWHVGYYTKYHTPTYRGFDSFFGYYSGYIQYFNHTITQSRVNKTGLDLHRDVEKILNPSSKVDEYFTDLVTKESVEIIETHDQSQPLFLQVNHLAPHSADGIETMEVRNETQTDRQFGYIRDRKRRRFASMVSDLDESVGQIMASLKKTGMLANSIVLFMSDNGAQTEGLLENFGSNYPLRGLKFTLFEGGIRGVACLYSPLIKQTGRVVNQMIHVTDWLPTLYSAAGGNLNDLLDIDGKDQWHNLLNSRTDARDFLLLNIDEVAGSEAALTNRFKYIKGAKERYGNYYGDTGRDVTYPKYNSDEILRSKTQKTIFKTVGSELTPKMIDSLRRLSEVTCQKTANFPTCSSSCLFDIIEDPCESIDVSSQYPKIVSSMEMKIDAYRKDLVKQHFPGIDALSYPENFGGTWMPWKNHDIDNEINNEINNTGHSFQITPYLFSLQYSILYKII